MTTVKSFSVDQADRILAVPYLRQSMYGDLDIAGTLGFFTRRYVQPLSRLLDIGVTSVVDCSAGFGWFSLAYLLAGGHSSIAVDVDHTRLAAAKSIARIAAVDDRMEFVTATIQDLPLSDNAADLVVSIETLEHVGKRNIGSALQRIADIASKGVLLTTPNRIFPLVAHDTQLPFIHWLPPSRRAGYARFFGRGELDHGNEFASPLDLGVLLAKFRPASSCMTFANYKAYRDHYPFYLPYGPDPEHRRKARPSPLKAAYFWLVSAVLGPHSFWLMPSLSHIFIRREGA